MATSIRQLRIKIACKHRNCGDMQNSFLFFVVKNKGQTQKASGPKVADWQDVGLEKMCAMIAVELGALELEIGRI